MSLLARHRELAPAAPTQRARLLDAIVAVVAERGYAATSVAEVVRRAGVSRTTFYEQFAGKEACFLAAFQAGCDVLDDEIGHAVAATPKRDWRAQLRAGIGAYLAMLDAHANFARVALIELHAAGPAALDARAAAMRRFAERYEASARQARSEDPRRPTPPRDALLVLCAGTEALAAERLRQDPATRLRALEDVFCHCAEAVLCGPPPEARERAAAPQAAEPNEDRGALRAPD